jgi:phenylacetate-CoA ligase
MGVDISCLAESWRIEPGASGLEIERLPRGRIHELQDRKLRRLIAHCRRSVPFYQALWQHLDVAAVGGIDDLPLLPLTTKADHIVAQSEHPPFGSLLSVDPENRPLTVLSTSGTKGTPRYYPMSAIAWHNLSASFQRHFVQIGLTQHSVLQVILPLGLGLGTAVVDAGMFGLGATTLPTSPQQFRTRQQLDIMRQFGTKWFMCSPTYALRLADYAQKEMDIDVRDLSVRVLTVGGEPGPESIPSLAAELRERWNADVHDWYGTVDLGMGFGSCPAHAGFHVPEDQLIVEVIDPDSGTVLESGGVGELVFTMLRPDYPSIRWRTGDIGSVNDERCDCGRNTLRITGIRGRADDMFWVKGRNVYPSGVVEVLARISGISSEFRIVLREIERQTSPSVQVERVGEIPEEALVHEIREALRAAFGVRFEIEVLSYGSLERSDYKAKRVIDLRGA